MKKQVILMSLAIAGLLCCIPMFVLNAPGAPGLSGGAASLLGMAGAVLFGTCAALVNTDTIEIVRQNLGFDLENGVTQVSLDLAEPHYYLEIRPLEG